MGQKDISEKILVDYNDVFADIVNVCAFHGNQIVPVVSFVLYFGTKKRWSKNRSIKELMEIPEGLDEFVNDYKINVIEIAWLTDEQLKMFKSDFGIVANFFVQRRKNKNYVPDDEREFQHVDAVLKLLSVMTGDNSYEEILFDAQSGKKVEVKTMCEVADRLKKMGLREGKEAGLREGKEAGLSEERLRIIQKKLEKGLSLEQIADIIELPLEEIEKLAKLLLVSNA